MNFTLRSTDDHEAFAVVSTNTEHPIKEPTSDTIKKCEIAISEHLTADVVKVDRFKELGTTMYLESICQINGEDYNYSFIVNPIHIY